MHAFILDPQRKQSAEELIGAVICEEVKANGRRLFHKGHRLTPADLAALPAIARPIHAVRLDADDVHEDEAGLRLATAVAGQGLFPKGPVQSRVNLVAERKGLLRVDARAVTTLNRIEGVAIFTLPDRLTVVPGKIVAGAKIAPVAIPRATLAAAEALAGRSPVVQVKPFRQLRVGVVTTEGLAGKVRDRFRETVTKKIGWYGGEVLGFADLPNDPDLVAPAITGFIGDDADLVLTGGGNTIDPLDAALLSLPRIGGEIVKFGAPAHPGSMFWLAYRGETPIFNLASCSMYSKATVADLILPWIMAGERVTLDDLAALGYGGLLDRDMGFRFPPYDVEATEEEDGEE
ncbi:MAG: molybdopterin-binding protein [Thermomicrobiales bacterium]